MPNYRPRGGYLRGGAVFRKNPAMVVEKVGFYFCFLFRRRAVGPRLNFYKEMSKEIKRLSDQIGEPSEEDTKEKSTTEDSQEEGK